MKEDGTIMELTLRVTVRTIDGQTQLVASPIVHYAPTDGYLGHKAYLERN